MNKITKVFDSIGFNFTIQNDNFVAGPPIKGYNSLQNNHIGYYIPYLVRNYLKNGSVEFEVGVGLVKSDENNILVERYKVVKSSNDDQKLTFANSEKKEFYIFANSSGFDTGFENVIVKTESFYIEPVKAIYLVDTTDSVVEAVLPPNSKADNVVIEIKLIGGNNPVIVRDNSGHILLSINNSNNRARLAYAGEVWYSLEDPQYSSFSSLSNDEPSFGILSDPSGSLYSFQYNNGSNTFGGSNLFWSSGNTNKLLLGSDTEASAHSIIPTSGTEPVIFNNDKKAADFLVYGSGTKNMFFAYDGRLGLNIPSGSRPQTIFHVINTICQEGFRLENRNPCHPANMTLYHAPSGSLTNGDLVGEINLAGKDTNGNRVNYARLHARALNWTAATPKGQFEITVATTSTGVKVFESNPDYTTVGYSNNNLTINSAGNTVIGYSGSKLTLTSSTATLSSPAIVLQSTSLTMGSGGSGTVNAPSVYASLLQSNNIRIPSIAAGNVLAIDSSGYIAAATSNMKFSSIPSGRILTTSENGLVTGVYTTDSFFLTEQDLTWNKYAKRTANVCLRQIVLLETVPVEEFSVGDQIAIVASGATYYRTVSSLDISDNNVVGMVVNQTITQNAENNVTVHSITRGGYLAIQKYVEAGTVADATSNILSIRPGKDTEFNTKQKDINFLVYGLDPIATFSVRANNGRELVQSGIYYDYATQTDTTPFAIPVDDAGDGISNSNNTANYDLTGSGSFSGIVSTVGTNGLPSYYGTYDQNGNVAEWVEDSSTISTSTTQYAIGGSWRTTDSDALRGYIPYNYSGSYDYIGFRICGAYGLVDSTFISASTGLNLDFVSVDDIENVADSSTLVTVSSIGVVPTGNNLIATGIANLGSVNDYYRISAYEITNDQYVRFLNVAATGDTFGLYDSGMTSAEAGGIVRAGSAGSYSYSVKTNMGDKPVNYVDYLSAIRFVNWLHNGAPTNFVSNSGTETGAYEIVSTGPNSYQITKNTYQKYWLPNIHQWYKAGFFEATPITSVSGSSTVLVKRDSPYLVASGTTGASAYETYASLNVSGWIYADHLILGDKTFVGPTGTANNNASLVNRSVVIESGNVTHKITMGKSDNLVINTGSDTWDGTYGNILSGSGIQLSASGKIDIMSNDQIRIYSPYPVKISGITATTVTTQNFIRTDGDGNAIATYPGTSGDILYTIDSDTVGASSQFKFLADKLNMPEGDINTPLYVNDSNDVICFTGVTYGFDPDNADTYLVTIDGNLIVNSGIRIGPELPFYSGSILTHNGEGYAYWAAAEYLKAEGMLWNRFNKRLVDIYENRIVFKEGTLETLRSEFQYSDTIALINSETREAHFIKASEGFFVVDGAAPSLSTDVIVNGVDGVEMTFCPQSPWAVVGGVPVSGYAYSVTKGAYLTMQIDPTATSGFDCNDILVDNDESPYSFKPSTLNRISIRPKTHTAFNMLAEDIDFVVYGALRTNYNRYEPDIFDLDSNGMPTGLIPGLKIDANIPNAVSGTYSSGVLYSGYLDEAATLPTGYHVDQSPKVCINTNNAFALASITSGTSTLSTYADLTVNKYGYISGLIVQDMFVYPVPTIDGSGRYVVNAPLTVNTYGQIVSQVPATAPTVPGSPSDLSGSPGYEGVYLTWIAPTNNGGRTVINYIIEYSANGGASWTRFNREVSRDTSANLTGLVNGVGYIFRVSAVNSVGTGAPSLSSPTITPSSSRPSAPRNLAATRGAMLAHLTWVASEYGSPTDYIVEYSSNDGLTWTVFTDGVSSSTGATVTGLDNAKRYLFRVKAENGSGYGIYAQVASLGTDPYTPPSEDQDDTSIWDFGKITFTGVCA